MIAVTQGETTDIPPHLQSWFEGNEEKTGQRAFWLAFIDTQIDPTVAPRERMFEGFRLIRTYLSLQGRSHRRQRCMVS